jgi:hypothetical protein
VIEFVVKQVRTKNSKGGVMELLDLNGLDEADVKLVRDFVEILKKRIGEKECKKEVRQRAPYHVWPLGVGEISRREMYDGE